MKYYNSINTHCIINNDNNNDNIMCIKLFENDKMINITNFTTFIK